MTTTPQAALLSDDEIERHFEINKSAPGRELRRLIGRSIEADVLAKLQATQAEPVQAGELPDERAAFERAMREKYDWQDHNFMRSDGYDYYADDRTESAWGGWIAAAPTAAAQVPVIPNGAAQAYEAIKRLNTPGMYQDRFAPFIEWFDAAMSAQQAQTAQEGGEK